MIPKEKLTEEQQTNYAYICEPDDIIKSLMLVSLEKSLDELKREKQMLKLL